MPEEQPDLAPVDREVFVSRYGPRALVAGGAIGMGAEYCRQIAAIGTRPPRPRPRRVGVGSDAGELRSAPGAVDVVTAVVDLGQPAEPLLDAVRRAVGDLEIGLLVANAAWSPVGRFLDSDLAAPARRDRHQLPGARRARARARRAHGRAGRGGIIVMSSLAAETGTANVALVLGDEGVRPRARRGPLVRAA